MPIFMNKKRFAKEWLYFLGWFLFGLLVLPSLLSVVFGFFTHQAISESISKFYPALVKKQEASLIAWLVVIGPYLVFQLVRSVVWAWKTARSS